MKSLKSCSHVAMRAAFVFALGSGWALQPLSVLAQNAPPAQQPPVNNQSGDEKSSSDSLRDQGVTEIIVTAQRRSENLQDVPISVTAISGAELESSGVSGTIALSSSVPSVQVQRSGPGAQVFIRGVGNVSGGTGEENTNAFYIDGVYLTDQNQINIDFNNVERVEVLKGPQGTLFGRNSSGGLVNVITRDPGQETEIRGRIGYANYGTSNAQLYAATPLSSTLSVDIALTGRNQEQGWGKNLLDGSDTADGWQYGARTKVLWRPNDFTKLTLAGDYTSLRDSFTSGFNLRKGSVGTGGFRYLGDYNINTTDPVYATSEYGGISQTSEFNLNAITVTNIIAYRTTRAVSNFDADYTPAELTRGTVPSEGMSFQEELRFSSAGDQRLAWQSGFFALHSSTLLSPFALRGLALGGLNSGYDISARQRTQSLAPFGEVTFAVTPTTHLTGGVRYTMEDRQYTGSQTPVNLAVGSPLYNALFVPQRTATLDYNKVTFRAAIKQDITDNINVYASFNRGFKSGGYALTASPASDPVKPQTIDATEVGFKSELFDRKVRFNLAAFHYKIDDYQTRAQGVLSGTSFLLNAATVKVNGAEGELEFAIARGLKLTSNFVVLDSKFTAFPLNPFTYPNPAVCTSTTSDPPGRTTGPATGGNKTCFGSAVDNLVPLAPKFAGNAGFTYSTPFGGGDITATALYSYNDGYFFEADNRLRQKSFSVVNASVEYQTSRHWGLQLFVRNLTDSRYYVSSTGGSTADQGSLAAPRVYGGNVTFGF
jgi:iron complex outermembrane receptor protein